MKYVFVIFHLIKGFCLYYVPYLVFLILIAYKLSLFAHLTETIFLKQGWSQYASHFFHWLWTREESSLTELEQGLVIVSTGAVILTSFWIFMLPRKARFISLFCLNFVLTALIFADLLYFRYFEDLISTTVLLQIGQVGALGDSISNLFFWLDGLFFIDLLLFLPFVIYLYQKIPSVKSSKKKIITRMASTVAVFSIGFVLFSFPIKTFIEKGGSYLFERTFSNMKVYGVTGLLGFHGYDLYRYVNGNILNPHTISEEEADKIQSWYAQNQQQFQEESSFTGIAQGKNVIVVQMEAFENFVIDRKVNGQEITPNLNQLKKESMYFNHFYHQTASGRTSDAEFLVQTSLYPLLTGSAYILYSGNAYTALPQILKDKGYTTAAFHAYKKSFWNRYLMYPTLGFDTFYSLDRFVVDEQLGWALSDESMFKQSFQKITELQEPFYSFLITLSSHHPYSYLPPEYQKLNVEGIQDPNFKNYLQSVHYTDKAIGQFIQLLKGEGLWENSIVILYGDHDSGLMKVDNEMAELLGVKNDPLQYNQVSDQVPLLIHLPNGERANVYEQVGGQIDLAPTILDLVGIKPDNHYMIGTSLFQSDRMVVFRKGSFTTNEVFYEASSDGVFENGKCYNLQLSKETTLTTCKQTYENAIQELYISDSVLRGDLIKGFLNGE